MLETNSQDHWCPMARISLQSEGAQQRSIEAVNTGAFNRVLFYTRGVSDGAWSYPARCLGEGCACWKWGFFSSIGVVPRRFRRGQCGLRTNSAHTTVAAILTLIGVAATVVYLFGRYCQ